MVPAPRRHRHHCSVCGRIPLAFANAAGSSPLRFSSRIRRLQSFALLRSAMSRDVRAQTPAVKNAVRGTGTELRLKRAAEAVAAFASATRAWKFAAWPDERAEITAPEGVSRTELQDWIRSQRSDAKARVDAAIEEAVEARVEGEFKTERGSQKE